MSEITEKILAFNQDRLPEMVQMKYRSMKENMYRFYRGTCHLFMEAMSVQTQVPAGPTAWISGDLHLENFGSFRSDNNQVYFDLNDFDEAILAPATWEIARLVTSIFIAFETLGIEEKRAQKMATLFIKSYSATLQKGKPRYIEPNIAKGIVGDFLNAVNNRKQRVILEKRTVQKRHKLEIMKEDPRHFVLSKPLRRELFAHVEEWLKTDDYSPYNYQVIDVVFRLAGTGSIGLKRYAFLLKTLNKVGEKYMLIDMKQAVPSSLQPFSTLTQPAWESEASRIISVQKRMQNHSPALLSTSYFKGDSFVMQEMQPTKDSINFKQIKRQYRDMYQVVDDMAMLTASSQLRSTGQDGSAITDDLKKFGSDESWQQELLQYCVNYSHQLKQDYANFLADYKRGAFKPAIPNLVVVPTHPTKQIS